MKLNFFHSRMRSGPAAAAVGFSSRLSLITDHCSLITAPSPTLRSIWVSALTVISAFSLLAQPAPSPSDTNDISQAMQRAAAAAAVLDNLSGTNDAMLPEDLISGDAPDQADELASTNAPASGTSMTADASNQYTPRSGRQSRSRRYSRQRSGQSDRPGGGYSLDSTNSSGLDYGAFRVVADKNIFDPNRRPYRPGVYQPPAPNRNPQYFTLVGTMSYEKGRFAFFTGTSSEYQKALKDSDTIAGYKLTGIASDSVSLSRDTNQVQLKVGMQMRLDNDGAWRLSTRSSYEMPLANATAPSNATASSPNSPATAENESDVLKRMRARREQD